MQISIERLKSTLLELSSIGFNEADKGIYRTSFSESDMAARRWLLQTLGAPHHPRRGRVPELECI